MIIGIDPSLTATGLALGDPLGTLITVTSKPHGDTVDDRWHRLAHLVEMVGGYANQGDLVIIEAPSLAQASQRGTLDRNGLWWLLVDKLMCRVQATVVEVSPSTLKKFATGKGNATKPDMRMALFQRAARDVRDDNQVDAWWLHQIRLHLTDSSQRIELPKANLAALDKIQRPDRPRR